LWGERISCCALCQWVFRICRLKKKGTVSYAAKSFKGIVHSFFGSFVIFTYFSLKIWQWKEQYAAKSFRGTVCFVLTGKESLGEKMSCCALYRYVLCTFSLKKGKFKKVQYISFSTVSIYFIFSLKSNIKGTVGCEKPLFLNVLICICIFSENLRVKGTVCCEKCETVGTVGTFCCYSDLNRICWESK
jgi:hypothetical protein